MRFSQIIGQQRVKDQLIQSVNQGRVSHAQLLFGPPGNGKFALALAYAQYLNCEDRRENDSCGTCPSCVKVAALVHPDVHFIYPTATTKKVKKDPESKVFAESWRKYVLSCNAYVSLNEWFNFAEIDSGQGTIYVRDASEINRRLSFKAYEGAFKIVIIWLVEKLHLSAANKLLKLLEEPPENTLFILITEELEQVLSTVKSRSYQIKIPRIEQSELATAVVKQFACSEETAHNIALIANGNWLEAIRLYENAEDEKFNFHTFQQWLRLCFKVEMINLTAFCENIASIGREKQKALFIYGLRHFRNCMLHNHNLIQAIRLPADELNFAVKFSPFLHHNNILQLIQLMEDGIQQIERNVNAQVLLCDTSLQMIQLLKVKP